MSLTPFIVIGSGPAGIAAANALVKRGCKILILDGGEELEPEIKTSINAFKKQSPEQWDQVKLNAFSDKVSVDPKGVQVKLVCGSDYPYAAVDKEIPVQPHEIGHLTPSLAKGGFSNVWGSAVMPYSESDISDWPLTLAELEPYYKEVLEFMPLSARSDRLEKTSPIYTESPHLLPTSKQAMKLLDSLSLNRRFLEDSGVSFGVSRLAVYPDCVECGYCLYGCPHDLIYSTRHTLAALCRNPLVEYAGGYRVIEIKEDEHGVEVVAIDRTYGDTHSFKGKKVYLAAGVISSAKILLSSFKRYDISIPMPVSEYFILPMFQFQRTPGAMKESLHTLSQVFIEVFDKAISKKFVHLQVYSYSDLYKKAFSQTLKFLGPLKLILMPYILERMLVVQGYLHSEASSSIELRLDKSTNLLHLSGKKNISAALTIRKIVKKLMVLRKYTGAIPVSPMLQIGKPGDGRHAGATFPMSREPTEFQTDLLGRPFNSSNIHVVDASVLPSIPAPTITFTAMANAARIAATSLSEGK